jgi:hypothetical protein
MVWVVSVPDSALDCGRGTDLHPAFDLAWEYWSGGEWRPLSLLKDQSLTFTRSGPIYLKTPAKEEMRRGLFRPAAAPLYWIRARVRQAAAERAPHILALRPNTAAVLQAETVRDEVLGGGDGAHQCFNSYAGDPAV